MRRLPLLLILLAAACAPSRPELAASPADAADAADTVDPGPGADVVAGEVDPEVVTIRMAADPDWDGDPAEAGPLSLSRRVLADLAYAGLTSLGPPGELEGDLARTWVVSDDRLTWTFHLDPDARAADGSPVLAPAVVESLDRVVARGPADQTAALLWPVEGWADRAARRSTEISGVTAPDATTVQIRLESPFEALGWVLADPALGVALWGDDGPVATGEFVWDGDTLRTREGAGREIRIEPVVGPGDPAGVADAFGSGELDWAVLTPGRPSVDIPGDTVRVPLDVELGLAVRLVDPARRRAVAAALDPAVLRATVPGLLASPVAAVGDGRVDPGPVVVASGASALEPLAAAVVEALGAAGVEASATTVEGDELAVAIGAGEVAVFPLLVGARGPAAGVLRALTPGAVDDVWGLDDPEWAELARRAAAAPDGQRSTALDELVAHAAAQGAWVPLGRFEARVAVAPTLRGLAHRADGTFDLSGLLG